VRGLLLPTLARLPLPPGCLVGVHGRGVAVALQLSANRRRMPLEKARDVRWRMAMLHEGLDLVSLIEAQLLVRHRFLFVVVEDPTEGVRQLSHFACGTT